MVVVVAAQVPMAGFLVVPLAKVVGAGVSWEPDGPGGIGGPASPSASEASRESSPESPCCEGGDWCWRVLVSPVSSRSPEGQGYKNQCCGHARFVVVTEQCQGIQHRIVDVITLLRYTVLCIMVLWRWGDNTWLCVVLLYYWMVPLDSV